MDLCNCGKAGFPNIANFGNDCEVLGLGNKGCFRLAGRSDGFGEQATAQLSRMFETIVICHHDIAKLPVLAVV
jgi:hypothetical protein